MTAVPKWATELIEKVCSECERPVPEVQWHRSYKRDYYSGRAWPTRIHIRIGKDTPRWEQKLVVLHELSHYLLSQYGYPGEHHSERFWTLAFLLYRRHGVPLRKALANERSYRETAVAGAKRARELVTPGSASLARRSARDR